jgi:2-C-methyl-D-erythritol 2,4-cyclodiphosphate synthase
MNKKITPIIVAAGKSVRMGFNKQLCQIAGLPAISYSYNAFCEAGFENIIVVVDDPEIYGDVLFGAILCRGGATRQESVRNALQLVPDDTDFVAIHDGARPMITPNLINLVIDDAIRFGSSIVAVPAKDTIKFADSEGNSSCVAESDGNSGDYTAGSDGNGNSNRLTVTSTPDRSKLFQVQTPQVFEFVPFKKAIDNPNAADFTDDSQLMEMMGVPVNITLGDYDNIKLTTPSDVIIAEAILTERNKLKNMGGENSTSDTVNSNFKIGQGYDVHKLVAGRKLILGGVEIPHTVGLLGHSDADVLVHAIMDAILGAAGLGDIGRHFPDTDERFRGADSLALLKEVVRICGHKIGNIDATVIAQSPKLAPHIPQMKANIEAICNAPVNIKATTEEHLGFTGRCEGISAQAVVLLI